MLCSSHLITRGASVGGITRRFTCHNTRTRVDQKFATRSFSACLRANFALPDSVFCNSCAVLLSPVDRRRTRLSSRLVSSRLSLSRIQRIVSPIRLENETMTSHMGKQ